MPSNFVARGQRLTSLTWDGGANDLLAQPPRKWPRLRSVILVPLDVSLHVLRRHQTYLMAQRAQLPRPVVRRRTRLHPHQTARQSTEERQNLRTPKLLAQNRCPRCIDPVYLENMLRQV